MYSNESDSVARYQPTSPQRMLSTEESDAILEAVLTQRTSTLLSVSDPDVQQVLRKSYSLDDLANSDVPVICRAVLLIYFFCIVRTYQCRGPSYPEIPEIWKVSWNLKLSWNVTHLARMSWNINNVSSLLFYLRLWLLLHHAIIVDLLPAGSTCK